MFWKICWKLYLLRLFKSTKPSLVLKHDLLRLVQTSCNLLQIGSKVWMGLKAQMFSLKRINNNSTRYILFRYIETLTSKRENTITRLKYRNGNSISQLAKYFFVQSITRSIDNNFSTIDKNTFNITLTAGGSPGLVVVCDDSCF